MVNDDRGGAPERGTNSYCFFVAVWGEKYIRSFLDCCLPSQFADGNLPALAGRNVAYLIYTRPEDAATLERAPAVQALRRHAAVEIRTFTDERLQRDGYMLDGYVGNLVRMTWCTQDALRSRRGVDTAFFFLNPDSVWANGAFRHADELQQKGIRAVMALGLITVRPRILAALENFTRSDRPGVIDIAPRELVRITLENLHPLSMARFTTRSGNRFRSAFFWPVGDEGLVTRNFFLHPICVRPRHHLESLNCTVDYRFVQQVGIRPEETAVVDDSDDLFYVDLAESDHVPKAYPLAPYSRQSQLDYMAQNTDEWHRDLFGATKVLVHAAPIHAGWAPVAEESDRFLRELYADLRGHQHAFEVRAANLPAPAPATLARAGEPPMPAPAPPPQWLRAVRRLARRAAKLILAPRRTARNVIRRLVHRLLAPIYRRIEGLEAHAAALQNHLHGVERELIRVEAAALTAYDSLGITWDAPPDQFKPFVIMLEYEMRRRFAHLEREIEKLQPVAPHLNGRCHNGAATSALRSGSGF